MVRGLRSYAVLALCLVLVACATTPPAPDPQIERDAIAARMMRDIEVLASDKFGGRKPGTAGGEQTVSYIIDRMREIGLQSGTNDPGSEWRAPVSLIATKPVRHEITVRTPRGSVVLPAEQSAAFSASRRVLIDGVEVLFLGNSMRDIPTQELQGRIVIVVGPERNLTEHEALFAANPAAVLSVVRDEAALTLMRALFEQERLLLADQASDRLSAFVTSDAFANALPEGEWERLITASSSPDFQFEILKATIAIDAQSERREFVSSNVIGRIPGAIPEAGSLLLMAHWDHLGECAPGTPDPICNGAVDNASGVALMLELAARLKAAGPHDRDIYLLATSAEESGLLGAKSFVDAPPMPIESIVAAFNFDSVAVARAGGAFGLVGEGRTKLDPLITEELEARGTGLGNREFADSFLRRHDGWVLLERAVPSVLLSTAFSSEIVLGPYLATDYHRPTDEIEGLQMGGAVDDLLLHETLVKRIASTVQYPAGFQAPDPVSDTSASQ